MFTILFYEMQLMAIIHDMVLGFFQKSGIG